MKQALHRATRAVGLEVHRLRPLDVNLFDMLTHAKLIDELPIDAFGRAFLHHVAVNIGRSHAQRYQDLLVDFIFDGAPGTFCEFGATDGDQLSNSAFLEAERGWRGVLSEPGEKWHAALRANRPDARIDTRCVYSVTGERVVFNEAAIGELSGIAHLTGDDDHRESRLAGRTYEVATVSLDDMLADHGIERLDYLSVDTEGSELLILERFDFARFDPGIVTVEHNFTDNQPKLHALLSAHGFAHVFADYSKFDAWYVRPDLLARAYARHAERMPPG